MGRFSKFNPIKIVKKAVKTVVKVVSKSNIMVNTYT
jgi:hypothetical protein